MCVYYSGWNFCTSWIQLHQTSALFKRRHGSRWWNVGGGMRKERYFWRVMSIEEIAQQMGCNASIQVMGAVKGFFHFLTIPWTGVPSDFSSSLRYEILPHTSYAMLSPLSIPEWPLLSLLFYLNFIQEWAVLDLNRLLSSLKISYPHISSNEGRAMQKEDENHFSSYK